MVQLFTTARAVIQAFTASIVISLAGALAAALLGWLVFATFGAPTMIIIYGLAMLVLLFLGAAVIAGHCAARLDRAHPVLAAALTALPIGLASSFIFDQRDLTAFTTIVSVATATLVASNAGTNQPRGVKQQDLGNQEGGITSSPGAARG